MAGLDWIHCVLMQTFGPAADELHLFVGEVVGLLAHQVEHDLLPSRCLRQRNIQPLHQPPPGSLINFLRPF